MLCYAGFSCQVIVFIRVRASEHGPLTDKKHILKSASIISLVTIVSRVLGYVRDQRITLLLGTTLTADSYFLAYRIPNIFRRLVAEGDRKSTRLNSSHLGISYAVFCLKKK